MLLFFILNNQYFLNVSQFAYFYVIYADDDDDDGAYACAYALAYDDDDDDGGDGAFLQNHVHVSSRDLPSHFAVRRI